ncbi:acetylserotonin o-methyltransferase-like [Lichtheimia corymbifera JMRC:FSU:9682]|uniref:Acetylserotonin o-methyltransferase-like n=1 Tax=Lichtheimia corymbifera JMRC:FSU:9682 TaxID=1263082 RepID=A0A068SAM9_9FUNG|nr:acetylserotonin o-methyltransferase-like [Lichtheimia corymbifera JMRC:FSU:9682]
MIDLSWLPNVANKKIVLASASPRRRELLSQMGVRFEVVPTLADDCVDPYEYRLAQSYVSETAEMKAEEVWERCQNDPSLPDADIVIAADTVINASPGHCDILNKPGNAGHAEVMLSALSGKEHQVLTGVHIIFSDKSWGAGNYREKHFVEGTMVKFAEIDPDLMKAYIASGEPFDKAGGYGIQGPAAMFIESIEGDYYNVVGLPIHRLYQELRDIEQVYQRH